MSHEIDVSTGKAGLFVTGEPAWHRLGTVIKSAATSAEAIGLAGLDWQVEQWPVSADGPGGQRIACPGRLANVRSDTHAVLGVVGKQYRVFQNAEAFDFMDAIVGEKLAMYETAGSLKGGRRVWMLARIPKEYRVGEDLVEPYVLLTNAHDGTQSLRMLPTTVRVVCQNTLNLALRGTSGGLCIPHWPKLESRVREARQKLGIIGSRLDDFGQEMQALCDRKLGAAEVRDYFRGLFPTETREEAKPKPQARDCGALLDSMLVQQDEQREVVGDLLAGHYAATRRQAKHNRQVLECVLENFDNQRNTLPGIKHSAWAAYSAVGEWADHQKRVNGQTQAERDDNRLNSIWFGSGDRVKQQAYQAALSLVN